MSGKKSRIRPGQSHSMAKMSLYAEASGMVTRLKAIEAAIR
jgi:hypothetical protein